MENNPTTEIRNEKTLFALIEKWGEERNFYGENGTTAKHQFMKLIEESGEMAGNIARGRNPIDDIGDQAVVITHIARLCDLSLIGMPFTFKSKNTGELRSIIDQTLYLHTVYSDIAYVLLTDSFPLTKRGNLYNALHTAIGGLHSLALEHGTTLLACMEHSYAEIKDRKGQMVNNVFVKESDIVQDAVEDMEKPQDGPVKDELPGMYELVSESYYMLRELTEKKRQEKEIDTETFEMHKKAMIEAMTPEEMVAQVNMTNSAITILKQQRPDFPIELISDGYHTFKELYEFRMLYNAALFNAWACYIRVNPDRTINDLDENKPRHIKDPQYSVHKSWKHHDGELCFGGGWFIVSAMLPTGLISNHYKAEYWEYFHVPEAEEALFEFDGHTSEDVIKRLTGFILTL